MKIKYIPTTDELFIHILTETKIEEILEYKKFNDYIEYFYDSRDSKNKIIDVVKICNLKLNLNKFNLTQDLNKIIPYYNHIETISVLKCLFIMAEGSSYENSEVSAFYRICKNFNIEVDYNDLVESFI